nr:MAG: minor coat protein [Plant associated crinivirus 1]
MAESLSINDITDLQVSSSTVLGTEIRNIINKNLVNKLKEVCKLDFDDPDKVIQLVMYRLYFRTTSKKVTESDEDCLEFKIKDKVYKIDDHVVTNFINSQPELLRYVNPLRVWSQSNASFFLQFARNKRDLVKSARALRQYLPTDKQYLAADFITGTEESLNDEERATLVRAKECALKPKSDGISAGLITLQQLGGPVAR